MLPPRSRRRPKHFSHPAGDLFLSWRLRWDQPPLAPHERDIVLEVIGRGEGVLGRILGLVVMDDHVHVLITPAVESTTARIAQTWKSTSAHRLTKLGIRAAPIWQENYWDRTLAGLQARRDCLGYIAANPRRRWPGVQDYPWLLIRET
jgi:hypothetical protein